MRICMRGCIIRYSRPRPLGPGSCRLNGHEPTCRDEMFQQLRSIMELGDPSGAAREGDDIEA